MDFKYFDAHSHLYFPDYDKDREDVIEEMKKEKVGTITIATDLESSKKAIKIAEENENIFACVGQHPGDINENSVFEEKLNELVNHPKVVAIGECGLDYFRLGENVEVIKGIQKTIFEYHIDLSLSSGKPLMLHIRNSKGTQDAYLDCLELLEKHANLSGNKLRGNAHFFSGDLDILRRFLAIGFTVSFTGVITFTSDYDELIKYTPLDMILAETDAPFVSPAPYRGKRNSPVYVEEVVKRIAELKNEPLEVVRVAILDNLKREFPAIFVPNLPLAD